MDELESIHIERNVCTSHMMTEKASAAVVSSLKCNLLNRAELTISNEIKPPVEKWHCYVPIGAESGHSGLLGDRNPL